MASSHLLKNLKNHYLVWSYRKMFRKMFRKCTHKKCSVSCMMDSKMYVHIIEKQNIFIFEMMIRSVLIENIEH